MCSVIPPPPFPVGPPAPTYGFLIQLLREAEDVSSRSSQLSTARVLAAWFEIFFPDAPKVSRPGRFESTVRKIAAPVQPFCRGSKALCGDELESYLERLWQPKITTPTKVLGKF